PARFFEFLRDIIRVTDAGLLARQHLTIATIDHPIARTVARGFTRWAILTRPARTTPRLVRDVCIDIGHSLTRGSTSCRRTRRDLTAACGAHIRSYQSAYQSSDHPA